MPAGEAHVAGQYELVADAASAAANLGDAHDRRGRETQHKVAPKVQHPWLFSGLGYVEMGDKKSGLADWNMTTFTDGSASRSVISAPNSTIVAGPNMLIGGLRKVIVHRPGWTRSVLNCEGPGIAILLHRLATGLRRYRGGDAPNAAMAKVIARTANTQRQALAYLPADKVFGVPLAPILISGTRNSLDYDVPNFKT